jgi:hypothetical protein
VIIFNIRAVVMLVIGFGIAYCVGELFGVTTDGPRLIMAGPLTSIIDWTYRVKHEDGHWFSPNGGGSLFFLPLWAFGIVFLVMGISYTIQGR